MDYIIFPKKSKEYYEQKLKSYNKNHRFAAECKGPCNICDSVRQSTLSHLKSLTKE